MTGFLLVQALVFALWAVQAFGTVWRLAAKARRDSGLAFPGPTVMLAVFRDFVTLPEFRTARWRLGILTLVLLGLSVLSPVFLQKEG